MGINCIMLWSHLYESLVNVLVIRSRFSTFIVNTCSVDIKSNQISVPAVEIMSMISIYSDRTVSVAAMLDYNLSTNPCCIPARKSIFVLANLTDRGRSTFTNAVDETFVLTDDIT